MKRIVLILSLLIISAGIIIAGHYNWKQKIEKITEKANVPIQTPSTTINTNGKSNSPSGTLNTSGSSIAQPESSNQTKMEKTGQTTLNLKDGSLSTTNSSATTNGSRTTTSSSKNLSSHINKTLEEIKAQYFSQFSELEVIETSKIDQLVGAAQAEYASKKTPKDELAAKYQSIAKQMEQSSDNSFYVLFQQLQDDLNKNGYSLNEAQEFQHAYNTKKQEHLNRLIEQVRGL